MVSGHGAIRVSGSYSGVFGRCLCFHSIVLAPNVYSATIHCSIASYVEVYNLVSRQSPSVPGCFVTFLSLCLGSRKLCLAPIGSIPGALPAYIGSIACLSGCEQLSGSIATNSPHTVAEDEVQERGASHGACGARIYLPNHVSTWIPNIDRTYTRLLLNLRHRLHVFPASSTLSKEKLLAMLVS